MRAGGCEVVDEYPAVAARCDHGGASIAREE